MNRLSVGLATLVAAVAMTGCNVIGGDSGGGGGVNNSSWFGTYEDSAGALDTILVEFDGSGDISKVEIGGVDQGFTATVTKEQGDIYGFEGNDGTAGGFLVNGDHGVYLTESFEFGSVQKKATALASSYSLDDVVGSWSGNLVLLDAFFQIVSVFDSSMTVNPDHSFGGQYDSSTFHDFNFLLLDSPVYGRISGAVVDDTDDSVSDLRIFLTPDKQFAGSWGCYPAGGFYNFPTDCSFQAWGKD